MPKLWAAAISADARSAMGWQNYGDQPWNAQATMWNAGAFGELTWYASDASRVIGGARVDYASARDKRATTSGMMTSKPNPTFDDDRARVLPSGFVRYERDLASLPVTWYAGIGHAERYPDYWELFSPDPKDPMVQQLPGQFRAELHDRLMAPLYPFAFAALTFAFLGTPRTTRQSRNFSIGASIAAVFGLTESRICQIHTQVILGLRAFLTRERSR